MEVLRISQNIDIPPQYLDEHIEDHIRELVEKKFLGTCTKNLGYIEEIVQILDINENVVSRTTPNVIFHVRFEAKAFLPKLGMKIDTNIIAIYAFGVMLNFKKFKVFVPMTSQLKSEYSIDGYKPGKDSFSFKKDGKEITKKIGDLLEIMIVDITYTNREFRVIGTLNF